MFKLPAEIKIWGITFILRNESVQLKVTVYHRNRYYYTSNDHLRMKISGVTEDNAIYNGEIEIRKDDRLRAFWEWMIHEAKYTNPILTATDLEQLADDYNRKQRQRSVEEEPGGDHRQLAR